MSSAKRWGLTRLFGGRLDILYFILAGIDLLTICTALLLNHVTTSAFEEGVRTSAAWSIRQADIIHLARLAHAVDAPGNNVFESHNVAAERVAFNDARQRFELERLRMIADIQRTALSERDDELLRRIAIVKDTMDQMVIESEFIFAEFDQGRVTNASRGMAVMDRTFARLTQRIDDTLAIVDAGRTEHLQQQLSSARLMRQLDVILTVAVVFIVGLVAAYGASMSRALNANQKQRAAMLQEIAGARDRLQRYADNVSHELRGPISKVRLGAELLLRRERTPDQYREGIETMLVECERLTTIVDALLFLARTDNTRVVPNAVTCDLAHELNLITDFYAAAAEKAGVHLQVESPPIALRADRALLQRAISNLVANSLDYSPKGGSVVLSARAGAEGVVINICDDGPGISDELRSRVFERFYRGASAPPHGVGLGLSIVKSIMDLHGGTIALLQRPEGGTCARLTLPPKGVPDANRSNYNRVIFEQ